MIVWLPNAPCYASQQIHLWRQPEQNPELVVAGLGAGPRYPEVDLHAGIGRRKQHDADSA